MHFCHHLYEERVKMRRSADRLTYIIKTELQNRKAFFCHAEKATALSNLKLLIAANITAVVFLVLFLLLTPYIIPGWTPTLWHIAFLPALLVSLAAIVFYYVRGARTGRGVTLLCVIFDSILLIFSILLDSVGTPDGPGTFLSLMLIVIPSLFTIPFYLSYSLTTAAETAYIIVTLTYKDTLLGRYDIFSSVAAFSFSLIIANMIMVLRIRDFTLQRTYKYRSMTDRLTNILNKDGLYNEFGKYLHLYNPTVTCTLIFMDLDNFKTLNDTKGHTAGDKVLRHTGMLLVDTFRHADIVGRFGGDEFVILMKDAASKQLAEDRCTSLQKSLRAMSLKESGIEITGSFGVVLATGQEVLPDSIFRQADAALYEAKRNGKATFVIKEYHS